MLSLYWEAKCCQRNFSYILFCEVGKSSLNLWIFWRYLTKDVYLFSASLTYCKNIWGLKIIHVQFYSILYLICTLPTNDLESISISLTFYSFSYDIYIYILLRETPCWMLMEWSCWFISRYLQCGIFSLNIGRFISCPNVFPMSYLNFLTNPLYQSETTLRSYATYMYGTTPLSI